MSRAVTVKDIQLFPVAMPFVERLRTSFGEEPFKTAIIVALHTEEENHVWIAYPDGGNGEKVYESTNGGLNWVNLTSPALNDEHISYLLHQGGTEAALYAGSYRTIWFKNDAAANWTPYNDGLPASISTDNLRYSSDNSGRG